MVEDRNAVAEREGFLPLMRNSKGALIGLNVTSNVLTLTIVGAIIGLPLSIVYLVMLFGDHKRLLTATATA